MAARAAIPFVLALLLALSAPAAARAAWQVNTTVDAPDDGECLVDCTLREAIGRASATTDHAVTVPPGTYGVTEELDLSADVTITGAGPRSTVIDGANATRVLHVTGGINQVSGVTIARGSTASSGGGIRVEADATLTLSSGAVTAGAAASGGGIASDGTLTVNASTVSDNLASASGGGIAVSSGDTTLVNSTVSGNAAQASGGGVHVSSPATLTARNVTIARNRAATAGGVYSEQATIAMRNTIVADSLLGGACNALSAQGDHNLDDDNTCGFSPALGDQPGVDPRLAALANNGGLTDTHALPSSSAALNGGSGCERTDQRGARRPQLGVCDIGAFEFRAPRLTIVTQVINDEGGTLGPADFTVHVRVGAGDIGRSTAPGSAAGRTYAVVPGTYTVAQDADSRYSTSLSGHCSANGAVTLSEGQSKRCVITNTDDPPEPGRLINATPAAGTVRVKPRGWRRFHVLWDGEQLRKGSIVDARRGRLTLFAAANRRGAVSWANFSGGIFRLDQTAGSRPLTTLTLVETLTGCKRKRRLWGDGIGRFRIEGRYSAATAAGLTKWLVQDRCDSTLSRVMRGRVSVRDFVKHKSLTVKARKRYVARRAR